MQPHLFLQIVVDLFGILLGHIPMDMENPFPCIKKSLLIPVEVWQRSVLFAESGLLHQTQYTLSYEKTPDFREFADSISSSDYFCARGLFFFL